MIYVTGDIHARPDFADEVICNLDDGAILFCTGEWGYGFFDRYCNEEKFYDYIAKKNIIVLIVEGNHENFARLGKLPVSYWNGGRVHKIRDNIMHCLRGEVFTVEDKTIFTFGGGYSLNRESLTEGIDWWPEENISESDRLNGDANLSAHDNKVDFCLSHTAPLNTVAALAYRYWGDIRLAVPEEFEITNYLQHVAEKTHYPKWYFSHFHRDVDNLKDNQIALMYHVRNLETGEIVYTRKRIHDSTCDTVMLRDEWV